MPKRGGGVYNKNEEHTKNSEEMNILIPNTKNYPEPQIRNC